MFNRKDQIKTAIAAAIVILLILTAVAIVYKYSVEGEENMPFRISRILIVSTAGSEDNQQEDSTEGTIIQNNDVYIEIQKSEEYNKDAVIKTVEISNITITKTPSIGEVKTYMPSTKENRKFTYSDQFILEGNSLTYNGAGKNDTSALEINNQGGEILIGFGNKNLGTYELTEEGITMDGTILRLTQASEDDIKFTVNFDLIINTEGKKYKTNMDLELPVGDIITEGKASLETTNTSKYVFKRVTN